jgi:hypothetical protein
MAAEVGRLAVYTNGEADRFAIDGVPGPSMRSIAASGITL